MTSGLRTAQSSRAAKIAESDSPPVASIPAFMSSSCAPGADPRIAPPFAAAMPATCVPWAMLWTVCGMTSESPSP